MDAWADETPLYIWSEQKADLAPVKAAKRQIDAEWEHAWGQPSPYRMRPIGVASLTDLPSLDARVLAIGSRPPFICDYALTSERTSPEGWHRALLWVMGINGVDEKATTILDVVDSILGPGVVEISPEQLESEKKARDYMEGR